MLTKLLDLVERSAWTAVQTFCATMLTFQLSDNHVLWKHVLYSSLLAAGVAAMKVVVAQNFSRNGLGGTLPQSVAPIVAEPSPVYVAPITTRNLPAYATTAPVTSALLNVPPPPAADTAPPADPPTQTLVDPAPAEPAPVPRAARTRRRAQP